LPSCDGFARGKRAALRCKLGEDAIVALFLQGVKLGLEQLVKVHGRPRFSLMLVVGLWGGRGQHPAPEFFIGQGQHHEPVFQQRQRGQGGQQGKADDVGRLVRDPEPFEPAGHRKAQRGDRDRETASSSARAEMAGQVREGSGMNSVLILRTPR
jgi:hypothetical protein